jgi:molecular chaperone GrpE
LTKTAILAQIPIWLKNCFIEIVIEKLKNRMAKKKKSDEAVNTAEEEVKKEKKSSKKARIQELEIQNAEAKDKYLRLFAEFENYKKRTLKEKLELMKNAAQDTMQTILPVLDDFNRAKKSADDDNSVEQFSEGVQLVYDKLHNSLKAKGLIEMESTGEVFDPELHEAITEIPAPSDDMKGKIIDTIESGYYLNDKIIRHAKVVVGK